MGKTNLAISLAIAAAQNGRRVCYGTVVDLITSLEDACRPQGSSNGGWRCSATLLSPGCHLVNIRGNSDRMRQHMDLYQALRADAAGNRI